MWTNSKLKNLLHIDFPIIQAPMAGNATTPELVAAASNAGALGSIGAGYLGPEEIRKTITKVRTLSKKPFAVNLFIPNAVNLPAKQALAKAQHAVESACAELKIKIGRITPPYVPSFEEQMKVVLEENVSIFSFTFGIPDDKWIAKCKEKKIILLGTATTVQEAMKLAECDIDIIVAQGSEAGGHRGTFLGRPEESLLGISALLPQIIDKVKLPVLAAGGVMDARGIVAALTYGAVGVQMGTAFLSCDECGIHPNYKKRLLRTQADETILTRVYSGKMARGIKNKFIANMEAYQDAILDYPLQHALTAPMRKIANEQDNVEFLSMWAGQSAYLSKGLPAGQLIKELDHEVRALLEYLAS